MVPCGMWPSASCDVESVGHGGAVLAFPVSHPLEAVSLADAASVDVEGDALAAPLLEPSLTLGVRGPATAEAPLCVAGGLDVMLAVPVPVGALLTWEVNWTIGSKSLLASWRCAAV